jgi:hypothetical protein
MKEEDKKKINALLDQIECPKGFKCAESGFGRLCEARDFGDEKHLLCLEKKDPPCSFALIYDYGHETRFCRCPLRVYLARNIGK